MEIWFDSYKNVLMGAMCYNFLVANMVVLLLRSVNETYY